MLTGSIPKEMSLLSKLSRLVISINNLTGGIPPFLGNITSMERFSAAYNPFGGSIPDTLGHWKSLKEFYSGYLEMSNNSFSGKLTLDFPKLRDIYSVRFNNNNFHGSGEADDMRFIHSLKNCTRLERLELSSCNLIGMLLISIGNLSDQLTFLTLADNQFFGSLPSSIGSLVGLTLFNLRANRFQGKIPTAIGKLQKLQFLSLSRNEFSGPIPDAIGNLSLFFFERQLLLES
ncbi:leucine-rich repeat protein [Tanacetum coccineum]